MSAETPPEVWDEFLLHLKRLGTVGAVARLAGMPSDVTVRAKIRKDADFARRANALWKRRKSAEPHPLKYTEEVWEAFLSNLEKHGTINAATRLDGMPTGATVYFKKEHDLAFAARVDAVWKKGRSARYRTAADWYSFLDRLTEVGTPLAVCELPNMPRYGSYKRKRSRDPLFASRVDSIWRRREISDDAWETLLENLTRYGIQEACFQSKAPSHSSLCARRRIDPVFNARVESIIRDPAYRHLHQLRTDDFNWDDFLEVAAGLRSMRAAYALAGMPQETTVRSRARSHPGFRSALAAVMRRQTEARIALALARKRKRPHKAKAVTGTSKCVSKTFKAALSRDELYAAVAAAVPKSLPPITRDDIICDIMLAVLEGQITVGEIKANAKDYVREHWRMFGTLRDKSLDANLFDDGAGTLGDRLAGHGADYW